VVHWHTQLKIEEKKPEYLRNIQPRDMNILIIIKTRKQIIY